MRNPSASAFLLLITLFLNACSSTPVQAAKPAWTWKGFEIIGNHKVSNADIQALIPIHVGDPYQEDSVSWHKWCADIKTKFALPYSNCGATRYSNFDAYFIVDVVEPGFEYRAEYRKEPKGSISLANSKILEYYEKLYQRLFELFNQGTPPTENADKGYLDFSDPEMLDLVQKLIQLVPKYRQNILKVLENDKDSAKRAKAANLLNWTLSDLEKSIVKANRLLDDPDMEVRNNISRFTLHYVDKISNTSARKIVIDQLLLQLDRPTFADRNKSIFNLLYIAQKFPQDRTYIKTKGLPLIKYISTASILDNVKGIAVEVVKLLDVHI